jgi:hypothetical protein
MSVLDRDISLRDNPTMHRTVSSEAVCITWICLLDLMTTLYWVSQGQAREGNPLMAFFLDQGVVPFIVAKIFTFAPALVVAEWYRPQNPQLIHRLLRWVIAGYLFIYVAGVAGHYGRVTEFYRGLFESFLVS